jgi:hypothetical protein
MKLIIIQRPIQPIQMPGSKLMMGVKLALFLLRIISKMARGDAKTNGFLQHIKVSLSLLYYTLKLN